MQLNFGENYYLEPGGAIYRSTDQGSNWEEVNFGYVNYVYSFFWDGSTMFAGAVEGVLKSGDNGSSWFPAGRGPEYTYDITKQSGCLYAIGGTNDVSYDNGQNWQRLNWDRVNPISLILPRTKQHFIVAGQCGVYYNEDTAAWALRYSGLTSCMFQAIAQHGPYVFLASMDSGIFVTSNEGLSWQNVSTGLSDSGLSDLIVTDDYVFVGTWNSGVWRRPISEMLDQNNAVVTTSSTSSVRAFPNPASNEIAFSLNANTESEIRIVDLLGIERSRVHVKGDIARIDCSGLANGRCFAVIRENNTVYTIPLLVQH